ncbi:TetR/AcrR family transcriptional regulator [Enemella sp. A6]|uniref:TetR/AcrR family transcriptional regulator n=1 Tax=Enemella sp. A6 TaxID=3440152 RepID=UPI003EBD61CD
MNPERVARKREQIALTAGRLFATKGFEATSVADIAAAVGVSQGTIFYYFTDKPAVFRAIFERDLPAAQQLIALHHDAPRALPAILEVLSELARDAADPSASGLVVELLRRIEHDPELLDVVRRTEEVITIGLSELITRGIAEGDIDPSLDPFEAAKWLQAIVDAVYLNARPDHSPVKDLRRTALGYLTRPHRSGEPADV